MILPEDKPAPDTHAHAQGPLLLLASMYTSSLNGRGAIRNTSGFLATQWWRSWRSRGSTTSLRRHWPRPLSHVRTHTHSCTHTDTYAHARMQTDSHAGVLTAPKDPNNDLGHGRKKEEVSGQITRSDPGRGNTQARPRDEEKGFAVKNIKNTHMNCRGKCKALTKCTEAFTKHLRSFYLERSQFGRKRDHYIVTFLQYCKLS